MTNISSDTRSCPHCSAQIPTNHIFCGQCGTLIANDNTIIQWNILHRKACTTGAFHFLLKKPLYTRQSADSKIESITFSPDEEYWLVSFPSGNKRLLQLSVISCQQVISPRQFGPDLGPKTIYIAS